ncbi:acyltransferase family protein [Nocardioides sp. CER19]|uniref:acyltransferase family protein n=1 Tax=Nocardioides sp. CER19 TaxID=3038538 RepID=UPI002448FF96|nr:acyltransferase family protein [Nocardioides sp. CER19]MDH2413338.1 acyltransferase family protein [Nocardioides sp. CER19]
MPQRPTTESPTFVATLRRSLLDRRSPGRADIQGIRALAVVVVILNHLFGNPAGGFVGVDIFFVISGFLITGLLLREHERTGHISFLGFYRRRIRRILPAATLVLLVGVGWSYFVFPTARWDATRVDAVWAELFGANLRFQELSTDYFNATGPVSPFQHYWSLSIEEQFYFVWPWLMLLLFAVLLRRNHSRQRASVVVFAVLGVVTAASFVYAVRQSAAAPASAYFDSFTRVWELGVGALLAGATPVLVRIPLALRPALAWTGAAGMVFSVVHVRSTMSFPAPWGLLPVLSAALTIAAGTFADRTQQQRWFFPFTSRPASYVGDISYSLYVWHFPIIVIATATWGSSTSVKTKVLLGIVVVAVYSYHLVEDPIRRSRFLALRSRGTHQGKVLVSGLVVGCLAIGAAVVGSNGAAADGGAVSVPKASAAAALAKYGPAGRVLKAEIVDALGATAWPSDLHPSIDESIGGSESSPDMMACGTPTSTLDPERCSWGSRAPRHTAVIVGDSIAMTYATSLRAIFEKMPGWRFYVMGTFGCVFTQTLVASADPATQKACPKRKDDAVQAALRLHPDLLFVANLDMMRIPVGGGALTPQQFADSTGRILAPFQDGAGRIVMLSSPPPDKDIAACYTRRSHPSDCVSSVVPYWKAQRTADRAMVKSLGGTWIDARDWFCAFGRCPAFVGTTPTKVDASHMTVSYALRIAPAVKETLVRAGVLAVR